MVGMKEKKKKNPMIIQGLNPTMCLLQRKENQAKTCNAKNMDLIIEGEEIEVHN